MTKEYLHKSLLYWIVAIGALLRFYDWYTIPLMHDEFSALFRLRFDSLVELIDKGVVPDGHPAGIQVFLYYWTKIFGHSDRIIKLPFVLFGIAAIYYSFLLGRLWFGELTGLLTASGIATLQTAVMFSEIARPYGSGLLFTLIAAYYWTKIVQATSRCAKSDQLGFVLWCTLSNYNHHFSMLFIAVMTITGLFVVSKSKIKNYLWLLFAIILLYLPHIGITYHHLFINKGLDWLQKPRLSFPFTYISYVFHYSFWVKGTVLFILSFGLFQHLFQRKIKSDKELMYRTIALVWFTTPIVLGLWYSIQVKPVIQYSMLLFTFPYLLLFIFSFNKATSVKTSISMTLLFLCVNLATLVHSRKHHWMMNHQPFNRMATLADRHVDSLGENNISFYFGGNPKMTQYYLDKEKPSIRFTEIRNYNYWFNSFETLIEKDTHAYIAACNLPTEDYLMIREKYPYLVMKEEGFTYDYFLFSNIPNQYVNDTTYHTKVVGSADGVLQTIRDSSFFSIKKDEEWGPSISLSLKDYTKTRHQILDIKMVFKTEYKKSGMLVFELKCGEELMDWRPQLLEQYYDEERSEEWQTAYFSIRLTDVIKNQQELKDMVARVLYWNNEKLAIDILDFDVLLRKSNAVVYGLYEDLD